MKALYTVLLAIALSLHGCVEKSTTNTEATEAPAVYGNGVWYIDCNQNCFAQRLATFKVAHPELVVTAIAGDGTSGSGFDRGYFISTEPRSQTAK